MPRLRARSRRGCFPLLQRGLAAVPRREAPVPEASPGAGRGGATRPGARAGRVRRAAAVVFCASLAAPLLGAGGTAEAQEVLVSNVSSATSTFLRLGAITDGKDAVQVFTTGTNAGGYTLTSIELELLLHGNGLTPPAVTLHNVTVTSTAVTLGTAVATLTTSQTVAVNETTYTAPMDTTLGRSTTYGVFVEAGGNGVGWGVTTTGDEDATPATGWSIGNQVATRAHDATAGFTLGSDGPGLIKVTGTAKTGTNNPATGKPGITGTAQVGQELTATRGTIADVDGLPDPFFANASTTVQWIRVDGGTDTDISNATSSYYMLVAADQGKKIKVKVSFKDDSRTTEGPLISDATATVAAAPDTTPPTLTSATVLGSGTVINFLFSENIQALNLPPFSAFTVTADGSVLTTNAISATPGVSDGFQIQVSPGFVHQGQAVVVTYTDPTAGDDANAIQDTAGNDAATG